MDSKEAAAKALEKVKAGASSSAMGELASILFHSRTQVHVFHLRIKDASSFAGHKALNDYYDGIVGLVDGLVESYQGLDGLVTFSSGYRVDNNASPENIMKYFDSLCADVDRLRKDEKLKASWIQNQIDTVCELLYSTKYKLKFLK
jgi:DNA-binding ferritin-like protein